MLRLAQLRNEYGWSQQEFAKKIKFSQSTVAMWERGAREPSNDTLSKIAEMFGVTVDYLLGNSDVRSQTNNVLSIPVLGEVRAGYPMEAVENILDYEEVPASMANLGELFALRIKGDSMEPRIREGDVIIVQKTPDLETGEIGVVLVNGDAATVKKVIKKDTGILLMPFNPAYDPMMYTWEDIDQLPVVILGKVVELRAKF